MNKRRFGFPNSAALDAGETGIACRGEEHDVTIVWSIASGKRMILADGHEVHYSTNRGGEIDFSWTMKGNHILKVTAHAAPPLTATPGFRQYDLHIDGQSFFTMVSECSVYILSIYQPFLFIFLVGISSWSILGTANHNQAQSV